MNRIIKIIAICTRGTFHPEPYKNYSSKGIGLMLFFVMLSVVPVFTQSTDFSVEESEEHIAFSSLDYKKIIGYDDSCYYVLKHEQGRHKIEKLDENLNHISEEFILEWQNKRSYNLEYAVHFHDTIYLFLSRRGLFNNVLYVQTIDKSTLLQNNDLTELIFVDDMRGNYADFYFSLSREESKLLVGSRIKMNLRKTQFDEFYVFEEGLKLLWSRKDIYDFQGQGPYNNKYLVDEFGNISILSQLRRANIFTLGNPVKDVYQIHRYTNLGTEFNTYPVFFENIYIRDIDMVSGKDGSLICSGLFSNRFPNGIRGTFFFRINSETNVLQEPKFQPFDSDMLTQLKESEFYPETVIDDEELTAYLITDLIERKNGEIIMIIEQFYDQNYNTFNNLMIFNFSSGGYLNWQNIIRKRQDYNTSYLKSPERPVIEEEVYEIDTYNYNPPIPRNFCSYALIAPADKNDIVLLFNDHINNLEENAKPKSFNNPKKSFLAAIRISEQGNMTNYMIRKAKKRKDVYPQPLDYYDKRTNEIIIPAYKARKHKYLKIEFNF